MSKKKENMKLKIVVPKPLREADHISKRGIPYWFAPEWVRDLNGTICRIKAIKEKNGEVRLYMLSKENKLSFIQGSIQSEFIKWHEDRQIDYILLGEDPDKILEGF